MVVLMKKVTPAAAATPVVMTTRAFELVCVWECVRVV